jgi:predicted membrane GTPase involved in stress response
MDETTLDAEELACAEARLLGTQLEAIGKAMDPPRAKSTVWKILARSHVKAYMDSVQQDAQDAVRKAVVRAMPGAVATLIDVHRTKGNPSAARVTAARTLLEVGLPREPVEVRHSGNPEAPIEHVHAGHVVAGMSDAAIEAAVAQIEAREALRRLGVDAAEGSG